MKKIAASFLLTCFISLTYSQFLNTSDSKWRTYRKQLYFGGGATQFLGDLGGKKYEGKRFCLADLDLRATRWEVHYGFRYQFHPLFATSSNLYVGKYVASDYYTFGNRRAAREISIKSRLIELSQRFEFIFYSKYGEKMKREKNKSTRFEAYTFSGIGLTYFDPQAGPGSKHQYEGTHLRPFSTEGQGYAGGAKRYKLLTISIPFGFGVQRSFSRRRSIRFEMSYMKTFSDYMDDTSGKYFDYFANSIYGSGPSSKQIYFSNPSEDWNTFQNGDPRGGKGKDCYFFANFSFVKAMGMRNKRLKKSEKEKNVK